MIRKTLYKSSNICLLYMLLASLACQGQQQIEENLQVSGDSPPVSQAEPTTPQSQIPPQLDSLLNLDFIRGQFDPRTHPQFERVDDRYTDGDGSYYLQRDAYAAFRDMHAAAAEDSIELTIISAARNFNRQKAIWEAKWNGQRLLEGRDKADEVYPDPVERALAILRFSSMPGTSRHHWGTDLDVNALVNSYFQSGYGLEVYKWLRENAADHGFCQPYTAGRPHGYQEERWHWSYLPVAQPLTDYAKANATDANISGFDGAEVAEEIKVVERYILGINQACLE